MLARLSVMVVVLLGITPVMAATQTSMAARVEAVRRAVTARDHATALAHADSLWAKAPAHPQSALTRAVALAAAGRDAEAEQVVRVLLRWDARYARRALQDSTLRHMRERLGVDVDSLARLADLPVSRGEVWAVLEERDLVPEGTAWDPSTRSLLVGSLNKSKVVAIGADGVARDRVPSGAHGLGSVVGIHVDSVRGVLWVSSTPRFDNAADTITPAVFAFDVATGAFGRRVNMTGRPSFLNDLTTTPDGTLYVTDSRAGRVFTLRPDAQSFDTLMLTAPLTSPNGITVSDDGRFLFVSDI